MAGRVGEHRDAAAHQRADAAAEGDQVPPAARPVQPAVQDRADGDAGGRADQRRPLVGSSGVLVAAGDVDDRGRDRAAIDHRRGHRAGIAAGQIRRGDEARDRAACGNRSDHALRMMVGEIVVEGLADQCRPGAVADAVLQHLRHRLRHVAIGGGED